MPGLNTVTLLGLITDRGVTTRPNDNGHVFATFTLAIPEDNGFSTWVPCEAYGKALEAAETLEAGDMVAIEGKLKVTSWTDKAGQKQRRLVVLAWSIKRVLAPVAS